MRTIAFLNGLSAALPAQVRALQAFAAARPALRPQLTVVVVPTSGVASPPDDAPWVGEASQAGKKGGLAASAETASVGPRLEGRPGERLGRRPAGRILRLRTPWIQPESLTEVFAFLTSGGRAEPASAVAEALTDVFQALRRAALGQAPNDASADVIDVEPFETALFPPGVFGAEMAGRLAAKLGGAAVIGLLDVVLDGSPPTAVKRVYSQNLLAGFELVQGPYCLALSPDWFGSRAGRPERPATEPADEATGDSADDSTDDSTPARTTGPGAGESGAVTPLAPLEADLASLPTPPRLLGRRETPAQTGAVLAEAKTLVVAGRGLDDQAGIELAAATARALGADWGVSRPAAMSAWAPLDRLVGVSGTVVAPRWCLAVGLSGAAALHAGIRKAGFLAAVNSDPKAPIVGLSDLAVIGDAKPILQELLKAAAEAALSLETRPEDPSPETQALSHGPAAAS
ncbi:MAG: FAD-binding protein [Deltaproteobacteria bacterium]|nr:FAD-binding protein [Deltaproteobacteria bacterium]